MYVGKSSDGSFLVRESPHIDGAFILSLIRNGEIIHYQINRHGDDAFFSIGMLYCSLSSQSIVNINFFSNK